MSRVFDMKKTGLAEALGKVHQPLLDGVTEAAFEQELDVLAERIRNVAVFAIIIGRYQSELEASDLSVDVQDDRMAGATFALGVLTDLLMVEGIVQAANVAARFPFSGSTKEELRKTALGAIDLYLAPVSPDTPEQTN